MSETAHLPPMPWRLLAEEGTLVTLHWVPVRRARAFVPPQVRILSFLPGRTIGGLFLARYGPGSDLQYDELIAAAATVWYEGRPCAWVTHLFVDSRDSVVGGRELLGAPKHYAPFARRAGGAAPALVGEPERPICRIEAGRCFRLWPQRLRVVALHRDVRDESGASVVVHGSELRGRIGLTRARVEIPESSPLHPLGLGRPLLSLCADQVEAVLGGAAFRPVSVVAPDQPSAA